MSRLIRDLAKVFGPTVKDIVQRWSTTQTLSITKQLQSGIRYFDFRIAKKPKCDDVFLLHGLYGHKVETELAAIRSFLKDHPKEVVLIDCNHFYCMTEFDHKQCLSMFLEVLGDIMCPVLDMDSVNLETMWQNQLQVLVFYHCDITHEYLQFWPGSLIPSPWADTDKGAKLIRFLDQNYGKRRDKGAFYVSQGVLTPNDTYVVGNLTKSLKECLCAPFAPHFAEWLKSKQAGQEYLNICLFDFVEMAQYIPIVVGLNKGHV